MELPKLVIRHPKPGQRRSFTLRSSLGLLCSLLPTHYALAELPNTSVFANAIEIPDSVLGETRGKFIAAGEIMNFGVQMVTEWVTASGEKINAAGTLSINMSGYQPVATFQPVIYVEKIAPATTVNTTQGNNLVAGGNGLEQVTGVVQSIQVAGQNNSIDNAIGVSIRQTSSTTSSTAATANQLTTPDGNTAQVQLANNGFSVAVNVPNQGQAMQTIRSAAQGSGHIMQSVRLGGDLNQIRNRINLDIQTRQFQNNSAIDRAAVLSSLKQLNGINPF